MLEARKPSLPHSVLGPMRLRRVKRRPRPHGKQGHGAMAETAKLLVRGGQVYDHDGDVHHPAVADILIERRHDRRGRGPIFAAEGAERCIDAAGRLVVPGLINAHYHSHDVLCRGLFEELPLEIWLLYTLPMGANRSKEEVRARTLVGAIESLRCGITTVQDMLGLVPLRRGDSTS